MGPTGAGKSTLLRAMAYGYPQVVGTVEIGKFLRDKYGPAYFKGQAAPEHTQAEAWAVYVEQCELAMADGKKVILVDGQPRDISQALGCVDHDWPNEFNVDKRFVWINAAEDLRKARLIERTKGDRDDYELAMQRMTNDYRNAYLVFVELLRMNQRMDLIDTDAHPAEELAAHCLALWEPSE